MPSHTHYPLHSCQAKNGSMQGCIRLLGIHWPGNPDSSYAHYQWLALPPNAPHALHQQQVRQAAQHWLQSSWQNHGEHLHFAWSYCGRYALLAAAFCKIGVDATAPDLLDAAGWVAVLQIYGGGDAAATRAKASASTDTAAHPLHNCARRWTQIEAADKCLRTGLQEWSPAVALARADCQLADIPAPDGICASLAWCGNGG